MFSFYFVLLGFSFTIESKRTIGYTFFMFQNQRREKILLLIQENGSCQVNELSNIFGVTEQTIRQDLVALEKEDLIIRQHGGALLKASPSSISVNITDRGHSMEKDAIGKTAASFVNDGDSIILDSGTTISAMAKYLTSRKNMNVVTNALNIALSLGSEPSNKVLVIGGEFKPPTLSCTGERSLSLFDSIYVDKLFLATGGFSVTGGLSYPGLSDIAIKKAMIKSAKSVFLLADSSKSEKTLLASLGEITQVDYLITDDKLTAETKERIESLGVRVIIA